MNYSITKKEKKSAKQKIPHHQNSSKIEYDTGRHRGKTNTVSTDTVLYYTSVHQPILLVHIQFCIIRLYTNQYC